MARTRLPAIKMQPAGRRGSGTRRVATCAAIFAGGALYSSLSAEVSALCVAHHCRASRQIEMHAAGALRQGEMRKYHHLPVTAESSSARWAGEMILLAHDFCSTISFSLFFLFLPCKRFAGGISERSACCRQRASAYRKQRGVRSKIIIRRQP